MINAKNLSLIAGVVQQTLLVLIIRYSKTVSHGGGGDDIGPSYLNSVAVASAEVFKLCLSFTLEYINTRNQQLEKGQEEQNRGRIRHLREMIKPMVAFNNKESLKLIVPALLYLIQNNLLFVALANLSVGMYQVTNQGKLLTTALLSRIMLKKHTTGMQYASIALLGFGVAFIHLSEHYASSAKKEGNESETINQNQVLGLTAVLICCATSSFSGVYFEWVLKKSPNQLSVHCRNFHLASWSLFLAAIGIISNDLGQVKEYGLFHGFDFWVVLVVINQGMTGFVVSMIIKYADTVLKGFAISIAAVFATLLSVPVFGASISPSFVIGAVMVAAAVKGYSKYEYEGETVHSVVASTADEEKGCEEEVELLPKGAQ